MKLLKVPAYPPLSTFKGCTGKVGKMYRIDRFMIFGNVASTHQLV